MNVRLSRRPVPSLRHLEGRFPDAITAHLCTTASAQHFIVDSLDHVTVGTLARRRNGPQSRSPKVIPFEAELRLIAGPET